MGIAVSCGAVVGRRHLEKLFSDVDKGARLQNDTIHAVSMRTITFYWLLGGSVKVFHEAKCIQILTDSNHSITDNMYLIMFSACHSLGTIGSLPFAPLPGSNRAI